MLCAIFGADLILLIVYWRCILVAKIASSHLERMIEIAIIV